MAADNERRLFDGDALPAPASVESSWVMLAGLAALFAGPRATFRFVCHLMLGLLVVLLTLSFVLVGLALLGR